MKWWLQGKIIMVDCWLAANIRNTIYKKAFFISLILHYFIGDCPFLIDSQQSIIDNFKKSKWKPHGHEKVQHGLWTGCLKQINIQPTEPKS